MKKSKKQAASQKKSTRKPDKKKVVSVKKQSSRSVGTRKTVTVSRTKKPAAKPAVAKKQLIKVKSPKREINSVNRELKKTRQLLYGINRKIKNATNRYWKGKYNKQKKELLNKIQPAINLLVDKRNDLRKQQRDYEQYQADKRVIDNKLASIRRKKKKLSKKRKKTHQIKEELRKLNHQEAKYLLEKENLQESHGAEIDRPDVEEYDQEDWQDDGGKGFIPDARNPYHIYDADKKLTEDIESGEWDLFIIDGEEFDAENADGAQLRASQFWVSEKKRQSGTPLILRFFNLKKRAVKYLSANF